MQDNTESIRDFAESLWQYFVPKIEQRMANSVRYYRAKVTANNGDGTLTIQRPYDNEITVPCVDSMKDTGVGAQVTVLVFGGTALKNSIVVADGKVSELGGGAEEVDIGAEQPADTFKLWVDTSDTPDDGLITKSQLLDLVYPVGSIYVSLSDVNPTVFIGGTWTQIKDRFILAAGDTYSAGDTGGEAAHTLTTAEIPDHKHSGTVLGATAVNGTGGALSRGDWANSMTFSYNSQYPVINFSGGNMGGGAHNNMPPYLTAFVWQRTA